MKERIAGFTLIEVLVSTIIIITLMGSIVSIYLLYNESIGKVQISKLEASKCSYIVNTLQSKFDEIRASGEVLTLRTVNDEILLYNGNKRLLKFNNEIIGIFNDDTAINEITLTDAELVFHILNNNALYFKIGMQMIVREIIVFVPGGIQNA